MKIASIDDVPQEGEALLAQMSREFSKFGIRLSQTDYFSSGDAFFRAWHPGLYRIIFLDIFLCHETGIDIAKTIRRMDPKVTLVFCSTSNEFASESYEVQANYYLVKPVAEKSISQMIYRLNLLKTEEDMVELPDRRMLLLSQFVYSDYHNHSITVKMKNGASEKIWSSQADFLSLLSPFHYFLPVTPGTIINMKEVTAFREDVFSMSDGSLVPISKRKKKELEQAYKDYLFARMRTAP